MSVLTISYSLRTTYRSESFETVAGLIEFSGKRSLKELSTKVLSKLKNFSSNFFFFFFFLIRQ